MIYTVRSSLTQLFNTLKTTTIRFRIYIAKRSTQRHCITDSFINHEAKQYDDMEG